MATTKGRMALSFLTAALAAGSLSARLPQDALRGEAASERLLARRTQLGLDADHAFRLRGTHADELGQTHGHFQQTYRGVKVWGGDAITHTGKDGGELPLTNALHKGIQLNVNPALDASEALALAQQHLAPQGPFAYAPTTELVVYPENMLKNLDRLGGLVHSQRVLLALTQKGMTREASYAAVQRNAMKVWRGEGAFLDFLKADPEVTLSGSELAELFDLGYHFKHVDTIFARVFGQEAMAKAAE